MSTKFIVLIFLLLSVLSARSTLLSVKALKKSLLYGGGGGSGYRSSTCGNCNYNYNRYSGYRNYGTPGYGTGGVGANVRIYAATAPVYSGGYRTYGNFGHNRDVVGGANGYGNQYDENYFGYGAAKGIYGYRKDGYFQSPTTTLNSGNIAFGASIATHENRRPYYTACYDCTNNAEIYNREFVYA